MTRIITPEEAARILNSLPMYSEPGIIGDLARTVVEMEKQRDEVWDRYMMWTAAAETVAKEHAAAHERAAKAEAERDRLQDILDCETGKRAPGRWRWEDDEWHCGTLAVVRRPTGMGWFWGRTDRGTFYAETCHDYALEAIEAADRAAKENA